MQRRLDLKQLALAGTALVFLNGCGGSQATLTPFVPNVPASQQQFIVMTALTTKKGTIAVPVANSATGAVNGPGAHVQQIADGNGNFPTTFVFSQAVAGPIVNGQQLLYQTTSEGIALLALNPVNGQLQQLDALTGQPGTTTLALQAAGDTVATVFAPLAISPDLKCLVSVEEHGTSIELVSYQVNQATGGLTATATVVPTFSGTNTSTPAQGLAITSVGGTNVVVGAFPGNSGINMTLQTFLLSPTCTLSLGQGNNGQGTDNSKVLIAGGNTNNARILGLTIAPGLTSGAVAFTPDNTTGFLNGFTVADATGTLNIGTNLQTATLVTAVTSVNDNGTFVGYAAEAATTANILPFTLTSNTVTPQTAVNTVAAQGPTALTVLNVPGGAPLLYVATGLTLGNTSQIAVNDLEAFPITATAPFLGTGIIAGGSQSVTIQSLTQMVGIGL